MKILYEDNHLLVVEKPAGLLTQPTPEENESLEAQAKAYLKEKYQKPGEVFLHAVHRLDRPVSGIVLFARTSKALSRLNAAMREKKTVKRYSAHLEHVPNPVAGELRHHHTKGNHRALIMDEPTEDSKPCRLHYNTLAGTCVEIFLDTGRYHQIRAQFAHIGCPIIGDEKYGCQKAWRKGAIALHHDRLEIPHPITGEVLTFTSELPA